MDPTIIVGIIGAASTVGAALIGRSDIMDKIIKGADFPRVAGRWESSWKEIQNANTINFREILHITKQRGSKIYGYITMDSEPDKKWDLYGDFNGRFLRLFWHPSKEADDKLFMDYGCYFFELQGDGSFTGIATGFDWRTNAILTTEHILKRIK